MEAEGPKRLTLEQLQKVRRDVDEIFDKSWSPRLTKPIQQALNDIDEAINSFLGI